MQWMTLKMYGLLDLNLDHFQRERFPLRLGGGGGGGGGVFRFGSDGGVPLKPPNLYPSLRVILAENGTHY